MRCFMGSFLSFWQIIKLPLGCDWLRFFQFQDFSIHLHLPSVFSLKWNDHQVKRTWHFWLDPKPLHFYLWRCRVSRIECDTL